MRSEHTANVHLSAQASAAHRLQPTAGEAMRYAQRNRPGFIARIVRAIVK